MPIRFVMPQEYNPTVRGCTGKRVYRLRIERFSAPKAWHELAIRGVHARRGETASAAGTEGWLAADLRASRTGTGRQTALKKREPRVVCRPREAQRTTDRSQKPGTTTGGPCPQPIKHRMSIRVRPGMESLRPYTPGNRSIADLSLLRQLLQGDLTGLTSFLPRREMNSRLFHRQAHSRSEFPTVSVGCRKAMSYRDAQLGSTDPQQSCGHI